MAGQGTMAEMLLRRLGDFSPGLRTRDRDWTWDEVVRESAARGALARGLRTEGRPFHIAVLLENVPDYILWLGAAALEGATLVGINPTRGTDELAPEVRHTECQLLVTDRKGLALLERLDLGIPDDRRIIVDDAGYPALIAAHREEPAIAADVTAQTQMLLLFTSGTTGMSKAVVCSQGRLAGQADANCSRYSITADDVSYCCMPLFHGNALMTLWAPSVRAGATIALIPKFSASRFLPDVAFFEATYFTYVGKAVGYILSQPERHDDARTSLRRGFGTEASPEDQREFSRRFGAKLFEGYGSSEGGGLLKLIAHGPAAALGLPAHDGVRIVDPATLRECPHATLDEFGKVLNAEESVGEIVNITGAASFEGYYKNPEANAERVRNGWYWTGDLGYVDQEGYFYFAGRSGDWIRVDGENISALRTERVLRRHPAVLTAGVFAVPDPRSGDQVMAAVEVSAVPEFDLPGLSRFLAAQPDLGEKGLPRFVRVSRSLPTTGSGKLRKKEMQLEGWQTSDDVYHWADRGAPDYRPLDAPGKDALRAEFARFGRGRLLG